MTDATREQIAKDAEDFIANLRGIDRAAKQWIREAHGVGATRQHPISHELGRKSGLEVGVAYCIEKILDNAHACITRNDVVELLRKELEALKTEIKK